MVATSHDSARLVPDLAEAARFLEALAGDGSDGLFTFQTFDDDPERKDGKLAAWRHGTLAELGPWLTEMNRKGAGVFVTVNRTDGKGRTAENVRGLRALFADDDDGAIADPAGLVPAPSLVVRSKRGHHVYWRLASEARTADFREAQKAIAHHLGTDTTVCDLPRVMRLPGFFHLKDSSDPFMVRLVLAEPSRMRAMSAMMAAFPVFKREPAPIVDTSPPLSGGDSKGAEWFAKWADHKPMTDGSRHDALKAIVTEGWGRVNAGALTEGEAWAVVRDWALRSGIKEGEKGAWSLWEHGRGKGFVSNGVPDPRPRVGRPRKASTQPAATGDDATEPDDTPPWDAPIPLDGPALPPPLSAVGPRWFSGMVEAIAWATETPAELALGMGLAILGACCQRRFVVEPFEGYHEHLSVWTVTALPPGTRKSAVVAAMAAPLTAWERRRAHDLAPEMRRAAAERAMLTGRAEGLKKDAAKAKEAGQAKELLDEALAIEGDLPEVPRPERLWSQDVTPERLADLLAENDERMAIFSAEGGLFEIMRGLYSGKANFDIFLQAFSGDAVRVDRRSRPPIMMECPLLSMGLAVQPSIIQGLSDDESFEGKGLLARFFYALPLSPLGYRVNEPRSVPAEVRQAYADGIGALLDMPQAQSLTGEPVPHVLRLAPDAFSEWQAYQRTIEADMRPGERFATETGWAGKLPGGVLKLAGLLHCAEHADGEPWAVPIGIGTMEQALTTAEMYAQHFLAVRGLMTDPPAIGVARAVLELIRRKGWQEFKAADCLASLKRTYKTMDQLDPAFAVLSERHWIRSTDGGWLGRGRPPRAFETNPALWEVPADGVA